jgi:hypothetical protein
MTSPSPANPSRPRRTRRLRRILLGTAIGLVLIGGLVLLLGPVFAARIGRAQIEARLREAILGDVTVGEVRFSWPGELQVLGLEVRDPRGDPVVSLAEIRAEIGLWSALFGRYETRLRVERAHLIFREDGSGRLNVADLFRPPAAAKGPSGPGRAPGQEGSSSSAAVADLRLDLGVKDVLFEFHGRDGRSVRLDRIGLTATLDLRREPLRFDAHCGSDRAGELRFRGKLQLVHDGRVALDRASGELACSGERLSLDALEPLILAFAPLQACRGTVNGSGDYRLRSGRSLAGGGSWRVDGLHMEGPAVGNAPLQFALVELSDRFDMDDRGSGTQSITFRAGEALQAKVEGRTRDLAEAQGSFETVVELAGDLGILAAAAPGLIPLKPGVRLAGVAEVHGQGSGATRGRALSAAHGDLTLRLDRLAVTDERGAPLPIDPRMELVAKGGREEGGLVAVEGFRLQAGRVTASGHLRFDPAARTLGPSRLDVDADLDDLARKLDSVLELPFRFGGRIAAEARAESEGALVRTVARAEMRGLRIEQDAGWRLGPLDLDLRHSGLWATEPGGESVIEVLRLESPLATLQGSGRLGGLEDGRRRGRFELAGELHPDRIQEALGDLFPGLALSGSATRLVAQVELEADRTAATGEIETPGLRLRGGAFGEPGWLVQGGRVAFDLDRKDERTLLIHKLEAGAGTLRLGAPEGGRAAEVLGLLLALSGEKRGSDLDLLGFRLASSVAEGRGQARIAGLGQTGMSIDGEFDLKGDAGRLVDLARAFVPGLEGARAEGSLSFRLRARNEGPRTSFEEEMRLADFSLRGVRAGSEVLDVDRADISAQSRAELDGTGPGRLEVLESRLQAPGLDLVVKGRSQGFLGEALRPEHDYLISGTLAPTEFSRRLAALLGGYAAEGSSLKLDLAVASTPDALVAKGGLAAPDLLVRLPADPAAAPDSPAARPRTLRQEELELRFDLTRESGPDSRLELREARFASRTGRAEARGRLGGGENAASDLSGTADFELADLARDLGEVLGLAGTQLAGKTGLRFRVQGTGQRYEVASDAGVDGFRMTRPLRPGAAPVTVAEPRIRVALDATHDAARESTQVRTGRVEAGFLRGGVTGSIRELATAPIFEGLRGDFTYNPDRLGVVIAPWFPGRLYGQAEQRIVVTLDGRASDTDWLSVLRGSSGDAVVGLTNLGISGFALSGDLKSTLRDQQLRTASELGMNGGALTLRGLVDLRPDPAAVSTLSLKLAQGEANTQLSPILELISPIFGLGEGGTGNLIQGLLDVDLDLRYAGALEEPVLRGTAPFPTRRISGKGRVAINNLVLQGGLLGGQLLNVLGLGGGALGTIALAPVEFTITEGRLVYDKPLPMTIGGVATQWTGSIGLDRSLDMAWELPVTEPMVRKNGFLKFFQGEAIRIPVSGTTSAPVLQVEAVFADLAQKAIQKELQQRAGGILPGGLPDLFPGTKPPVPAGGEKPPAGKPPDNPLGGILGPILGGQNPPAQPPAPVPPGPTQPGNPPAGQPTPSGQPQKPPAPPPNPLGGILGGILGGVAPPVPAPPSAAEEAEARNLLARADALYAERERAQAIPIYRDLRTRLARTQAYRTNQAKIDQRAEEQP